MKAIFNHNSRVVKADAIAAVHQIDPDTVEIRYLDGTHPILLHNTTTSEVILKIDEAKLKARADSD